MKKRIITGTSEVIEFDRPELFLLALSCAAATRGLSYPSSGDVRWIESTFYDVPFTGRDFWYPYEMTPLGLVLKPMWSASYKYIARNAFSPVQIHLLDPTDWRVNVANLIADCVISDKELAEFMHAAVQQYFEASGDDLAYREVMDIRVRQAMTNETIILDSRKARAAMKRNVVDTGED